MLKFTKMQGLGNDFVLLDCRNNSFNLTVAELQFLADRKFGVGCDQILVIETSINPTADFIYRIFNADGSEAGHCGNGARCVIEYLWDKINKSKITLQIQKQLIHGHKNPDGSISINMGTPDFAPAALPFLQQQNPDNIYVLHIQGKAISYGICSVGNPHVMVKLSETPDLDNTQHLTFLAQLIQNSSLFPEGVNVNFYVIKNSKTIALRTYERGCGFTFACGTGATATACYAIAQHTVLHNVDVEMPGGKLNIAWDMINEIIMTGPAVSIFTGQLCN